VTFIDPTLALIVWGIESVVVVCCSLPDVSTKKPDLRRDLHFVEKSPENDQSAGLGEEL
jgi:hypothetical protein